MAAALAADTVLRQSDNVTFETVAEEAILIRLDTGTYFSLNRIGTEFWEMIDGEHTVAEHATVIADKYGVDAQMVTGDLLELAEEMHGEDLVEVVES